MKLKFKQSVYLLRASLDPPMIDCLRIALEMAPPMQGGEVVVTSGVDSHAKGLHPVGRAWDFRTRTIVAESLNERRLIAKQWRDDLRDHLGADWDVIAEEHDDPNNDHVHAEYDTKRDSRWRKQKV